MQPFSGVLLPRPRWPSLSGGGGQWVAHGPGWGGASFKETTRWEGLPAEPPAASGGSPGAWLRCRMRPFPLTHPRSCRGVWAAHAASTTEASPARCRATISGHSWLRAPGSLGCGAPWALHTPCVTFVGGGRDSISELPRSLCVSPWWCGRSGDPGPTLGPLAHHPPSPKLQKAVLVGRRETPGLSASVVAQHGF